jgi:flagellin
MSVLGIISNQIAANAQTSLRSASTAVDGSATKLSSGSSISKASDDVAGLAIGTILKTNISTLQAALTNTSQAQALLNMADGAVDNISQLLERMKSLSSQATAGTLSDENREFLDLEFQGLMSEIDRISNSTNFNDIKLIDGSLFNPNSISTDTRSNATTGQGTLKLANALVDTENIKINGVTFSVVQNTAMSGNDTDLLRINVSANSTVETQTDQLWSNMQQILNYSGTNANVLTAKAALEELDIFFDDANDTFTIISKHAGTAANAIVIDSSATTDEWKLNGAVITGASTLTANGTASVGGALASGAFSTGTTFGGTDTTVATGNVGDGILRAIATGTEANTGINLHDISNNPAFVGKISGFKATYNADNVVDLQIQVGNYTYLANSVFTNYTADTIVTFGATESGGGSFKLQFAANQGSAVTSPSDADNFAQRIDNAFSTINVYQVREINNYKGSGQIFATGGAATANGDLNESKFYLVSDDFSDVKIEDIRVQAPIAAGSPAVIEFVVNGEIYRSGYAADGATAATGNFGASATTITNGADYAFRNQSDPNKFLRIDYTSATALTIDTTARAEGTEIALKKAFGIGDGNGQNTGLTFQVGTRSSDSIDVQIQGTRTRDIFKDDNNIQQSLDIKTKATADAAGIALDKAIKRVTAIRAQIGSLQSRFEKAASNIDSSIKSQDGARATFLDTDIPSESTRFSASLVRQRMSTAMLAQANSIPQNLLSLVS